MIGRPIRLGVAAALVAAAAAQAAAAGGSISGVVVAERESRSGEPQLLLATPSRLGDRAIDEIRVELPRRLRGSLKPDLLPRGWGFDWRGKVAVLSGPPLDPNRAIGIALGLRKPEDLTEVGLELLGAGESLLSGVGDPVEMVPVETLGEVDDYLRLPKSVTAGEAVEFTPLDATATPPGGEWRIGDDEVTWKGGFAPPKYEWKVGLRYDFGSRLDLRISYKDPWGETLVDGTTSEVQIGEGPATEGGPSITACSPKVLSGGIVCVCGSFPNAASRRSLTLDGKPLGEPISASGHVLNFRLPEGTPPGPFTVAGNPSAGYGAADSAQGIVIAVGGQIDRDRLRRGQSTPLRLGIEGTDEPISLRLWNTTPAIVSLGDSEDLIVTTSGGRPNTVERTVRAVSPGDFTIKYELDLSSCPCGEDDSGAPPGDAGTSIVTTAGGGTRARLPDDCSKLRRECDELRLRAESLEATARSLRSAADRAAEESRRFAEEADWLEELSERDRRQIQTLRRQAGEWRELAAAARESAKTNWKRDKDFPGRNWDYWARQDEAQAKRRDDNARRLEEEAAALEASARENSDKAKKLRELVDKTAKAEAAATRAEAEAAAARSAYEACVERLAKRCPERRASTGTSTTGTGGGTTATSGGESGDDPRDTPPPTPYGEEQDEEKKCPQRDGTHPSCVALLIDYIKQDWFPGDLSEPKEILESMQCDIDYAAPKLRTVPPPSYQVERSIFSFSEMRFKNVKYWVNTSPARQSALRANRSEFAKVEAAIESHRAKLRAGAILGVEITFSHGSKGGKSGCGSIGGSADWSNTSLAREVFHQENYDAAKGNVCIWYVADFSCYSFRTVHAADHLNNEGDAMCSGAAPTDRAFHAGYEADIAQSCAHRGTWEVCNPYQVSYLMDDVEDAFEDEASRRGGAGYSHETAFEQLKTELREAANSSLFSFSTYADQGYEMCVPETHTRRGPYWKDE